MSAHAGGVLLGRAHQRLAEVLHPWLQASFEVVYMVGDPALAEGDLAALSGELHRRAPSGDPGARSGG